MKKTLLAAAVVGAFSVTAHAQSSVTLYGLIDAGIAYTSNSTTTAGASGSKNFRATSGLINGSRWGLKGSEDLGGGNKAIFVLENGFSINNGQSGQNGRMFGRQAFVGLQNDKFGAVTIGRQYDSLVDYLAPLTLNGSSFGGTIASHPYDNDNTNNPFRVNNSVKYSSANYNGLTFGGLYGFSNKAGDFANNRAFSAGVNYANGPLTVAAAYLERQGNPGNNNTSGAVDTSNGGDSVFNASKQRVWGIGGNYAFGPATVGLVYTHSQLQGLAGLNYNSTAVSFNNDGPLGTFFRYIGDTGTYIARYDDLVNGKEEKIDVSKVDVSMNGIELQDREFFAAIREGREPNASVAQVLPCYQVLHDLELQLDAG